MWKKNGNQIMLRCLLKHYKIRIYQVYTAEKVDILWEVGGS